MSEEKLDRILEGMAVLKQDVSTLRQDVSTLKQDVSTLKQDVSTLKQDVSALDERVGRVETKQDQMLRAFQSHWQDISGLYKAVREDLEHFEERVESNLGSVTQAVQALKHSLERQDFRSDELGRRVTRLEARDEPPL